jgi:hypothetical protein
MTLMAWLFSRTSLVSLLLLIGLALLSWGVSDRFGLWAGAVVAGILLLWAGGRAAKRL